MNQINPITLVMVCDNHLVVMLATLLKSIEKCHTGTESINIYIINDGIKKANISRISRVISSDKINIFWKTMKEAIPNHIKLPKDNTTYPICAYARICAPHFLSEDIKKAIYLDVDMLVLRNIKELWNIDIGNYVIAAVQDRFEVVSSPYGGIRNYKELGLTPETKYFNSGLLVINLQKWREMNATELVISTIEMNSEYVTFADQYALNVVFANNWYELDFRWNNFGLNTNKDPYLIHFTGVKPLFKGYSSNLEYKEEFYKVLKMTPWKDYTPKRNYIWRFKKVMNMISKNSWETLVDKFWKVSKETLSK